MKHQFLFNLLGWILPKMDFIVGFGYFSGCFDDATRALKVALDRHLCGFGTNNEKNHVK